MANNNIFLFATVAQVNYFSQVGRLIAEKNNNKTTLKIKTNTQCENVVCIHIPDSYGQTADILSAVKKAWRIDAKRCTSHNIKCVFAIIDKTIVGVYEFSKNENNKTLGSPEEGRKELNLKIANWELQLNFLGRTIDLKVTQQPIRYVYVDEVAK